MTGVIGIDEVGRGPLAGPVTVCACFLEDVDEIEKIVFENTIRDSKKLTKSLRNNIYQTLRQKRSIKSKIEYAVASRSASYIDKHGIVAAIDACIHSCLKELISRGLPIENIPIRLDGGLKVKRLEVLQSTHIKGDEHFVEIALASIIAKVHRDSYMERIGKSFDGYKWNENAGYGTKFHREAIYHLGITKHHRMTYLKAFKQFEKADR